MATAVDSASTPLSSSAATLKEKISGNDGPIFFTFRDDDIQNPEPPSLACLTDEHSNLSEVSYACLYLNQQQPNNTVLHDVTVAQFWSDAWRGLLRCSQEHKMRQCRILAAQTAALTARSVYGRIRPVVQLYSQRDPTPSRVEDDVLDVAMGLVNASLAEEDDGVAIAMLGSLGHLVLTSNTSFGAMLDDELMSHVSHLLQIVPAPYAPTARSVADEDPAVPTTELQVRVLEHAILSKLWPLVQRCILWGPSGAPSWPILTQALLYACNIPHEVKDRTTYATRWNQVEYSGLKTTFWENVLQPALEHVLSGCNTYTACLCALRLQFYSPLIPACIREEVSAAVDPERKRALIAVLFVALRPLPLAQRTRTLLWLADQMGTDLAFWSEFVISFQLDGPNGSTKREECWNVVLRSLLLRNKLQAHPIVNYAVLSVTIGTRSLASKWVQLAQIVLASDALCLGNNDLLWETALELWQDYLVVTGAITPSTSVAMNVSAPTRRLAARASEWKRRPPSNSHPKDQPQRQILSLAPWLPTVPLRWVNYVWALVVDQGATGAATEVHIEPGPTAVAGWQSLGMTGAARRDKGLVSLAVSTLQGKKARNQAEAAAWKNLRNYCEAAVGRIQAVYENPQRPAPMEFAGSETARFKLMDEPATDEHAVATRLQNERYRQVVAGRLLWLPQSMQQQPGNFFRLHVPPVHESLDGRMYGYRAATALTGWGHTALDCAAPSDPGQILLSYIPTRTPSCDGSLLFSVQVVMRVYNITAFTITDGLGLELTLQSPRSSNKDDPYTAAACETLKTSLEAPCFGMSSTFRGEIKSAEFVTWTVDLRKVGYSHGYQLVPSVVYLNVPVEKETSRWVGTRVNGETSTIGGESKSGEDDFKVTTTADPAVDQVQDVRLEGRALLLPPLIFFQPARLVFQNRAGDVECFLNIWSVLQHKLPPLKISGATAESNEDSNPVTKKIARMSSLSFDRSMKIQASRLWAFESFQGSLVFVALLNDTLHLRGDDPQTLLSLVSSLVSRRAFVVSLLDDKRLAE